MIQLTKEDGISNVTTIIYLKTINIFTQNSLENTTHVQNINLSVKGSQDVKQWKEKIDDIEIESNSSPDVLVVCVSFDQIISIIYNVATKDYGRKTRIYHHWNLSHRKEYLQKRFKKLITSLKLKDIFDWQTCKSEVNRPEWRRRR